MVRIIRPRGSLLPKGSYDGSGWSLTDEYAICADRADLAAGLLLRVDDRRVIIDIVAVLKLRTLDRRACSVSSAKGPLQSLRCWVAKGVQDRSLLCAGKCRWLAGAGAHRGMCRESAPRSSSGGNGGAQPGHRPFARRTHDENPRLTDRKRRRLHGHAPPMEKMPLARMLHADKGYNNVLAAVSIAATVSH